MTRFGLAASIGVLLAMVLAMPASAFELIELTGHYGDFGTQAEHSDSLDTPGAVCAYTTPDAGGFSYLKNIKVFAFVAIAYDSTNGLDHQQVRFKVTLQRSTDSGATWNSVRSTSETRTAWDNKSAEFDSLKVKAKGKAGVLYRTIVTLDWLRNGVSDGHAKMRMEYYRFNWVKNPNHVEPDVCPGQVE